MLHYNVKYFISGPRAPIIIKVESISSDSLNITWLPPSKPNGPITHYKINVTRNYLRATTSADHNYCNDDCKYKLYARVYYYHLI